MEQLNSKNPNYIIRYIQDSFFESQSQLTEINQIARITLIQTNEENNVIYPLYIWLNKDLFALPRQLHNHCTHTELFFDSLFKKSEADYESLYKYINDDIQDKPYKFLFPIHLETLFHGLVVFEKKNDIAWTLEERSFLRALTLAIATKVASFEKKDLHNNNTVVLDNIMNQMHTSLYITDLESDEILYMNKTMKDDFQVEHPEGKTCWSVLQNGLDARCKNCPKHFLLQSNEQNPVHIWEEYNPLTKKTYTNYDSLTQWVDGRLVHFQHSVDISETKRLSNEVNFDALTHAYSRSKGKEKLAELLIQSQKEKFIFSLCMIDVNDLKMINDTFGHLQGDHLLTSITNGIHAACNENDFVCRLSGDEFFVVFYHYTIEEAHFKIKQILGKLHTLNLFPQMAREQEFCYGAVQSDYTLNDNVKTLLGKADNSLYDAKKLYHIHKSEYLLHSHGLFSKDLATFTYNRDLLYEALVNSCDDYVFISNMKSNTFYYSQNMVDEFGLPGRIIKNAAAVWALKVHEADKQKFLEANQEIIDGRALSHIVEYRAKNHNGKWVWLRCRGQVVSSSDGQDAIFAGFISNLSKKNEIDNISGLYNKFSFEQEVDRLFNNTSENFALILLNIDDFKNINSLNNRTFGDGVIKLIAQKIHSLLSPMQSIYRLDGDEFGILCRATNVEEIKHLYERITTHFNRTLEHNSKRFFVSLSAGCSFARIDAQNFLDLNKFADYALNLAKENGKGRLEFFSNDILYSRQRLLQISDALRESVENNFIGFHLHYQPIFNGDATLAGAESLARFTCAKYGDITPAEFIPILESSGLIVPFGKWAFEQTIKDYQAFARFNPTLDININLSIRQLENGDFVPFAKAILEKYNVNSSHVIVELTESCIAENINQLSSVLKDIRACHMKVAMDDFGTGYSSLGLLKAIPFDCVKIDRTFVQGIKQNAFDHAFIQLVSEMCKILNIKSLLEGVEEQDEYNISSKFALDFFQGYYFGKPTDKESFINKYLRLH